MGSEAYSEEQLRIDRSCQSWARSSTLCEREPASSGEPASVSMFIRHAYSQSDL